MDLPPFQTLIDTHALDVHRFLVASVGPVDADDCYQETWIAALKAYPRVRDSENLRGWVFTIAHRKALDLLRARTRRPLPAGDALPEPGLPGSGARGLGPDPGPLLGDPARVTSDPELWRAVAALPPKQRTAVALRFIVDADYRAIATMMDTSEQAARANVHAGLRQLRREELDVSPA